MRLAAFLSLAAYDYSLLEESEEAPDVPDLLALLVCEEDEACLDAAGKLLGAALVFNYRLHGWEDGSRDGSARCMHRWTCRGGWVTARCCQRADWSAGPQMNGSMLSLNPDPCPPLVGSRLQGTGKASVGAQDASPLEDSLIAMSKSMLDGGSQAAPALLRRLPSLSPVRCGASVCVVSGRRCLG